MTRPIVAAVPPPLREALAAEGTAGGFTILLLTGREDGWPHLSMLSVGEVVVLDERRLRLALWPGSTAAARLAVDGRATIAAVIPPASYLIRLQARPIGELVTPLGGRRAAFEATVAAASVDEAPYAVLESGVRFRLKDPDATLPRWAEVRRALREQEP